MAELLLDLRRRVGDVEYGYRIQGFFAHVLMLLGAEIIELNAQGHPDIVATLDSHTVFVEVEASHSVSGRHVIKIEDIESIRPKLSGDSGYLAVLDAAVPVRWALLEYKRLRLHGPSALRLASMHAVAHQHFSQECTATFIAMVLENEQALANLSFHLLADRVRRGDHL